ncbi:hypothetical protein ENSA5_62000 [Enhygromyxa salina]|uniref:Dickkopf N-terminal cysteine-rich domain-containing protein n=1 Tax=Enhygromyxa salina TaxID=215803 RepID=A0A2S9XD19_9BACT|nr:ribulose phosphate epimerase [Enhygromyxa salina]PRP90766.1 hypothetical protein ENSA5_62000 [Enhygromyxa salina]
MRGSAFFGRPALSLLTMSLIACGPPALGPGDSDDGHETSSTTVTPDLPSTDTEADTEADTADDEDEAGFVPDYARPVPPCDPFEQDCPEGEKCVAYAAGQWWDSNKCVPVLGSQAVGEPCTYGGPEEATDNCDATSGCWNVEEIEGEWSGTCHAFCTGSDDDPMCAEGSQCLISSDPVVVFCIPTCDPLVQDCDEGLGCYWASNDFSCILTQDDIPAGQACGYINDCSPGLICVDGLALPSCEDAACCTPYCELMAGDAQCDAIPGTSCLPFFEQGLELPGYELVGLCIVDEP